MKHASCQSQGVNYNALYQNFKITLKFYLIVKAWVEESFPGLRQDCRLTSKDTYRTYLGMCFLKITAFKKIKKLKLRHFERINCIS